MTLLILAACATEEPRYAGAATPPCADAESLEPITSTPLEYGGGREDYGRLSDGSSGLLMLDPIELPGGGADESEAILLTDGYEVVDTWVWDYNCVAFLTNHYSGDETEAILGCYEGMYELVQGEDPELLDVDHTFFAATEDDFDGDGIDDVFDQVDWTTYAVWYGDGGSATLQIPGDYIYWGIGDGDWNGDGFTDQSHMWNGTGLGILYGGEQLEGTVQAEDVMILGEGAAYERALYAGDMDGDGYGDIMIGYGGKTGLVRGSAQWTGADLNDSEFTLISKSGSDTIPMGWADIDEDHESDPIVGVQNGDLQDVYAFRYCDEPGVIELEDVGAKIGEDLEAPLEEAFPIDLDGDRDFEILMDGNYILRIYEI